MSERDKKYLPAGSGSSVGCYGLMLTLLVFVVTAFVLDSGAIAGLIIGGVIGISMLLAGALMGMYNIAAQSERAKRND